MAADWADKWTGRDPLAELDPAVKEIIEKEKNRQVMGLELIASEVSWILYECYNAKFILKPQSSCFES